MELFEKHEELYHYTSSGGLLGIIQSKTLWATHYAHLNDSEEIIHFKNDLPQIIKPSVKKGSDELIKNNPRLASEIEKRGGIEVVYEKEIKIAVNGMYNAALGSDNCERTYEPYITSFCTPDSSNVKNNGLLSQWRGYGKDGGYAIILDAKRITDFMKLEEKKWQYDLLFIGDAVYSPLSKKGLEELDADLQEINTSIINFYKTSGRDGSVFINSSIPFLRSACRYKHCGFSEEREVRIVAIPTLFSEELIELVKKEKGTLLPKKPKSSFLRGGVPVPHLKLFDQIIDTNNHLPIKKIIVGPHPDRIKRARAVEILLEQHGINAEVSVSDIPYLP